MTCDICFRAYLRDQPVQVGVCRALNVQRAAADVVDGLIVKEHSDVCVLQKGVGGQNTVVGLNYSSGYLFNARRCQ
jgi:hypothetical protein